MRDNKDRQKRRASNVLTAFHILFLTAAIAIIVKIMILQYFWEPDYVKYFQPNKEKTVLEPERGAIIDHNGKLLAISTPMYDVFMDCYILKEAHDRDTVKGKKREDIWVKKAEELAKRLPEVLKEEGKTAS